MQFSVCSLCFLTGFYMQNEAALRVLQAVVSGRRARLLLVALEQQVAERKQVAVRVLQGAVRGHMVRMDVRLAGEVVKGVCLACGEPVLGNQARAQSQLGAH